MLITAQLQIISNLQAEVDSYLSTFNDKLDDVLVSLKEVMPMSMSSSIWYELISSRKLQFSSMFKASMDETQAKSQLEQTMQKAAYKKRTHAQHVAMDTATELPKSSKGKLLPNFATSMLPPQITQNKWPLLPPVPSQD